MTHHINFESIFSLNNDNSVHRPRFMEIGAGSGDWIISQASTSGGKDADWIALELRCDRVYQIFTKTCFNDLSNIAILGGDARRVVQDHIPSRSIDKVFINFPEPPHHNTGIGESQGNHLLTKSFLHMIYNCLVDPSFETLTEPCDELSRSGTITIVSDNISYIQSLASMIAEESSKAISNKSIDGNNLEYLAFRSIPQYSRIIAGTYPINDIDVVHSNKRQRLNEDRPSLGVESIKEIGEIQVVCGQPDKQVGHDINSSSYFDRLWENGNKSKRWLLYLEKVVI
jgi:tRNA G46 methylase TrmB